MTPTITSVLCTTVLYDALVKVSQDTVIGNREIAAPERIAEKFRFFGYFLGICTGFLQELVSLNGCQHYKHMSFDLARFFIHRSATAFRFRDTFHGLGKRYIDVDLPSVTAARYESCAMSRISFFS